MTKIWVSFSTWIEMQPEGGLILSMKLAVKKMVKQILSSPFL